VDVVVLALEAQNKQTLLSSRIIVAAPSEDSKAIHDSDSFSRNNGERAYKKSNRVEFFRVNRNKTRAKEATD